MPITTPEENATALEEIRHSTLPSKGKEPEGRITYEVDSDSDVCPIPSRRHKGPTYVIDVIEISSDSDEEPVPPKATRREPSPTAPPETPHRKRLVSRRRIVESSDEEESDNDSDYNDEVLELSDDSVVVKEPVAPKRRAPPTAPRGKQVSSVDANVDSSSSTRAITPVDESIIVFDEPSTARRPVRVNPPSQSSVDRATGDTDEKVTSGTSNAATSTEEAPVAAKPAKSSTTRQAPKPKAAPKTPRANTKKARLEAELQHRKEYAEKVFHDLNTSVFKDGLPPSTKLVWNKRLLTTAGKAKYHRSREGVVTTQVELAEKILDSDERIRNTLSHEMCHLATWVIDQKINEHHGSYFKRWAYLVEKEHPHIEVSVKHNYEISYPYEWKCEKCDKIYGRFSKSIKPEECLCGACREGKLVPQFSTRARARARAAATPKLSRMAAAQPQDSPRVVPGPSTMPGALEIDSEEDIIQSLTQTLATTAIQA